LPHDERRSISRHLHDAQNGTASSTEEMKKARPFP
jgi:hypothetical protein